MMAALIDALVLRPIRPEPFEFRREIRAHESLTGARDPDAGFLGGLDRVPTDFKKEASDGDIIFK